MGQGEAGLDCANGANGKLTSRHWPNSGSLSPMEAWAKSVKKTRSKLRERTNVHSLLLGDAIVIASMVLASKWEEGGDGNRPGR